MSLLPPRNIRGILTLTCPVCGEVVGKEEATAIYRPAAGEELYCCPKDGVELYGEVRVGIVGWRTHQPFRFVVGPGWEAQEEAERAL